MNCYPNFIGGTLKCFSLKPESKDVRIEDSFLGLIEIFDQTAKVITANSGAF